MNIDRNKRKFGSWNFFRFDAIAGANKNYVHIRMVFSNFFSDRNGRIEMSARAACRDEDGLVRQVLLPEAV